MTSIKVVLSSLLSITAILSVAHAREPKPELRIQGKTVVLKSIKVACKSPDDCEVQLFDVVSPCGDISKEMRGVIYGVPSTVGAKLELKQNKEHWVNLFGADGGAVDLGDHQGTIRVTAVDQVKNKLTFLIEVDQKQNVFRGSYTGEICH